MKARFFFKMAVLVLGFSLLGGAGSAAYDPISVEPASSTEAIVLNHAGPKGLLSTDVLVIAAGRSHTCALMEGGGVKCWGQNSVGELGDGTTTNRNRPVDVSGLSSGVVALVAGGRHTCALMGSGEVMCWGWNELGQLGDGTTINRLTPVPVTGLAAPVTALSAGGGHTCALSGGAALCWGSNFFGQLGNGTTTTTPNPTPVPVTDLASGATALAAGGEHTCALMTGGGAKCWGYNTSGQLGATTGTYYSSVPVDVVDLGGQATALVAGGDHTCARMSDSGAKCWGANGWGQLGDGTMTGRITPAYVSGLTSGVAALAAGTDHTCAVLETGGVKCWGWNLYGQVGDGTTTLKTSPVDVTGLTDGAVPVAAGETHSCVVTVSAGAKCWGRNQLGQLGDWTTTDRYTPVDVKFPVAACFLPLTMRNHCPDFYDDFSNPYSGWFVADTDWVRAEYLSGEYRILIKPVDYYGVFTAPSCARLNYSAEVTARWAGNSGTGYGLVFGIVGDYERFYLFLVNTDYQEYALFRYDGADQWAALRTWTYSYHINAGTASNQVSIIRDGSTIRLSVNGWSLDMLSDATITGATQVGVTVLTYLDLPNADARFDNFRAATYGASATTETPDQGITTNPSPAPVHIGKGAPVPMDLVRPQQPQEGGR
jgi:alpha-tubulin suppressor-like RCC1 family protein